MIMCVLLSVQNGGALAIWGSNNRADLASFTLSDNRAKQVRCLPNRRNGCISETERKSDVECAGRCNMDPSVINQS